ncbi:MAG TPA: thiol reductant ABC exporter subunit CydC [Rhodanobacteraceae bacterium]
MRDLVRLLRLGGPARPAFALGALLALIVVLANVALLGLAGWFIAAMAAAGLAGGIINYYLPAAGIRAFALVRTGGRYVERLVNHHATLKLLSHLRVWVYARIRPLAPAVLDRYRKGDVLTRLVANVDALDNAWLRVFSPMAVAALASLAVCGFLALYSAPVAWLDLALLASIGLALPVALQALGRRPATRAAAVRGTMQADLTEDFAGLAELTVLGVLPATRSRCTAASRDLARAQDRGLVLEAVADGLTVLCTGTAVALTWVLGARLVRAGHASPLLLPVLIFIVLASVEAVQALPAAFRALGDTLAAARRIFALADEKPVVVEAPAPVRRVARAALEFRNVGLCYPGARRSALEGATFAVPAGAELAIVGPSGAGKSSISRLALRFYEASAGTVLLGGQPVAAYALDALRTQFAWAPQSTRLFSTSIRENLRLAAPRATDADLWRALDAAAFAGEVHGFDGGLDHFVGAGGMALSAGQARRLALARAWLSPAPILLLDEPTEGLDAGTARTIAKHFICGRGRRSLIWITHQPLGLEDMDQMLVLDGGRIVERGAAAALSASDGFYRRMAERIDC